MALGRTAAPAGRRRRGAGEAGPPSTLMLCTCSSCCPTWALPGPSWTRRRPRACLAGRAHAAIQSRPATTPYTRTRALLLAPRQPNAQAGRQRPQEPSSCSPRTTPAATRLRSRVRAAGAVAARPWPARRPLKRILRPIAGRARPLRGPGGAGAERLVARLAACGCSPPRASSARIARIDRSQAPPARRNDPSGRLPLAGCWLTCSTKTDPLGPLACSPTLARAALRGNGAHGPT